MNTKQTIKTIKRNQRKNSVIGGRNESNYII